MRIKSAAFLSVLASCILGSSALADDGKLVFAVDLIRHGDRSPIHETVKDPHQWPQGLGQLSPEGMAQEFALGTKMRKRYITDSHLLPEKYQAPTMFVRSSDYDRTLMSAESLLLGLYLGKGPTLDAGQPALPTDFQPIPIHTLPQSEDTLLVVDFNHKLREEFDKLPNEPAWKAEEAKLEPKYQHWSEATGVKIKGLIDVAKVADTLFCREQHHIPLPAGITKEDADELFAASDYEFATTFGPTKIGEIAGAELLEQIAKHMVDFKEGKSPLKFVLYSGHDTTIACALSALKAPLAHRCHYASNLNFSVYDENGTLMVKVKLNDEPVNIPGTTNGACTLEKFLELVKASKA